MSSVRSGDVAELQQQISSTLALLTHLMSLSPETDRSTTPQPAGPSSPLSALADCARLIKAHTTKLSLLATNKPFTPSAISKILRQLAETCLPVSTCCVQMATERRGQYGSVVGHEIQVRSRDVFRELKVLLGELSAIANGQTCAGGRNSLTCTGVVWAGCDALVKIERDGVAGIVVDKANNYLATIKDALEELKEWREGGDPDHEGHSDLLLDSDDEGVAGDDESVDDLFNAANSLPHDRPEIAELAEQAEDKLKKIVLLYTALIKRRLKTYQMDEADTKRAQLLDRLSGQLKRLPPEVDELLAERFYNLDEQGARQKLQDVVGLAVDVAKTAHLDWEGKEDAFTVWSKKWIEAVG